MTLHYYELSMIFGADHRIEPGEVKHQDLAAAVVSKVRGSAVTRFDYCGLFEYELGHPRTPYLAATALVRADLERARRVAVHLEQENALLLDAVETALTELRLVPGRRDRAQLAAATLEDALKSTDPLGQ